MRALAERGAAVLAFTPIKADLEGAFWGLTHEAPDAAPADEAAPRAAVDPAVQPRRRAA
jgi:hypothetical protein